MFWGPLLAYAYMSDHTFSLVKDPSNKRQDYAMPCLPGCDWTTYPWTQFIEDGLQVVQRSDLPEG